VRFDFKIVSAELPLMVGDSIFGRDWGAGKPFDQVVTDTPWGADRHRSAG
jgi:microcin C transport system substrate-binding protein